MSRITRFVPDVKSRVSKRAGPQKHVTCLTCGSIQPGPLSGKSETGRYNLTRRKMSQIHVEGHPKQHGKDRCTLIDSRRRVSVRKFVNLTKTREGVSSMGTSIEEGFFWFRRGFGVVLMSR